MKLPQPRHHENGIKNAEKMSVMTEVIGTSELLAQAGGLTEMCR